MTNKLLWAAGRFVYPKGRSDHPVHFSPFQDFQLDDGPDFAHLYLIRARRNGDMHLSEEPVAAALGCTAASHIAGIVSAFADSLDGGSGSLNIMEYYPGVGLAFEQIKQILETVPGLGNARLVYRACGEESFRLKFEILHREDVYPVKYIADDPINFDAVSQRSGQSGLVIYNADEAVRHRCEQNIPLEKAVSVSGDDMVIAGRVLSLDAARESETLMTVRGRTVTIPSMRRFLQPLRENSPLWRYQFIPGFDSNFFLPGTTGVTGLCLAYKTRRDVSLPDFQTTGSGT